MDLIQQFLLFRSVSAAIHHMDYFNDVFTTFLGLKFGGCIALNAG